MAVSLRNQITPKTEIARQQKVDRSMLDKIDRSVVIINQVLKYVAATLLLIVAVLIAFDVVMRFVFNKPVIGIAEIVANGIVIIAFLQLSYAVRIGGMLRSDLLIRPEKRFLKSLCPHWGRFCSV